jgi:ANTAR domain
MTYSADAASSAEYERRITAAVSQVAARRAVIEQAKGMLMFIYGIDAEAAFGFMRWQSQQHNVKLRLLAEQIVKDLTGLSTQHTPVHRKASAQLLLTAHQRIADVAARARRPAFQECTHIPAQGRVERERRGM